MNLGLDIGYSSVKATCGERRVSFPSAVGSPEKQRFSLEDNQSFRLLSPSPALIGEDAVLQSRHLKRREDRGWTEGEEWYTLALAAFTELTTATMVELNIVTGLPVAFYDDREAVQQRLIGDHNVQRDGRGKQLFKVTDCRVIPQPFGTVLCAALGDNGKVAQKATPIATGRVGVIDIGGKTTNLLSIIRLSEVARATASVSIGGWDIVRSAKRQLETQFKGLELRDHEIAEALIARKLVYYGEQVDITELATNAISPLVAQVYSEASQLWNGGAALDLVLITGGGALLVGPDVFKAFFRHSVVVPDPVFANSVGYWKLAQRIW